jgi:glycerol-3-phosphate dehydrogenase
MYSAYFQRRLFEALDLAEQASSEQQRLIHLRTVRYYRDLLQSAARLQ